MKITEKWITKNKPCIEGINWAKEHKLIGTDRVKFITALMSAGKLDWANWLIVRTMAYKQYVQYAVYAAEQVIKIYEDKHPNDKRPREAIDAAKECIKNPSAKNKKAANSAYSAAYLAYLAAYLAAYSADNSANSAAYSAMKQKILLYGVSLIKKG